MSTSNRVVRPILRMTGLLALLVSLSMSAARAQIWQGPAALEIKAEGKGASVAGATVELLYLALDPPAGPPPVQLDARGRAVIGGLAEGMWRVSVRREGFMTYQAEVDVRRDEKPELAATFQQNVPGAVHMMQVKIARSKPSGPSVPPPPPQIAERPAPAEEHGRTGTDTDEQERAPAQPPAPVPAPTPQAPPREAVPPPKAPPREAPRPQPVTPAPAPQPVPQPAPQTPPPAPAPAPQQPAPEPEPRQPAPPAQSGSVLHRSYADRTCYECKPGEASLSAERVVSPGVGCGPVGRELLEHSGDPGGLPEGCAVLRLTLPAGARYTGYRYEIQERSGSVDCLAGRDCPGGGRWPVDPALVRSAAGTTVSTAFENLGSGAARRAILTVYFTER